jgi:glycosyltransferase involved in cell wall biosynthesis
VIGALPESLLNFRGNLLKELVKGGHEVTAMAAEADQSVKERLVALGIGFREYPVQRNSMNPVKDMKTFLALRKAFRELRPDVILSYTIKPVIWGGIASKGMASSRFYALITGLGFALQQGDGLSRRFLTAIVVRLYGAALSRASFVIFQNPDNRDFFVSQRIADKDKCAVVNGSGVDLNRFAVEPLPAEGPIFLAIGRLLGAKGFREYAHAAQMVKERYPDAVFRLVGPSDPSPDGIPDKEVRAWDTHGWVEYLGATNDVRPFIAGSHIYVLPSYHEGMPRTVLEAMAMGRPILTTDVPGCRETVIQGENGYLVPKGSTVALAERMCWFIEHRGKWEKMGMRSRALAEERFDVHNVNRELLKIMGLFPENHSYQEL